MKCFFSFLLFAGVISIQMDVRACIKAPKEPTISVLGGAQKSNEKDYYIVEIPEQGQTTVTIEGKGQTPCPTDAEKCKCEDQKQKQAEDGKLKYTFNPKEAGVQDENNGPSVEWDVNSTAQSGEYKFRLIEIEQKYKPCPSGWSGGVTSKSNTRESDVVTVFLLPVQITEVSFGGTKYWELKSDDAATTYSAPHWKDVDGNRKPTNTAQGEHDYAVAFTRNTKPKIGAKFKIASASNFGVIKIKAAGPGGMVIPETAGTVSGNEVTLPLTEVSSALVNTIKFYDKKDDAKAFKLEWEVKIGNSDWSKIGTTKHTVYVTLDDPKRRSAKKVFLK